jgi:glucokinase
MEKKYTIGIDLGGTNLRVGLISRDGAIVEKIKEPTSGAVLDSLLKAVDRLISDQVAGIGIGVAGLIHRDDDKVLISPNLQVAEQVNFVDEMRAKFNIPVIIENDANAAAFGEMWVGAGRNFRDFFLLTLGTGIGGGVIYERKLMNISAEIGHMSISTDGEKCNCGNYGCLEMYASATAILSKAVSVLEEGRESILKEYCNGNFYKLTAENIYKAALDGDTLSREILKNAGKYLGIGIANIINLMSPEAIILTGGLVGAWEIYVREAIREASRRAFKALFERVKIIPSLLMDDAGIIGAAGLVFQVAA